MIGKLFYVTSILSMLKGQRQYFDVLKKHLIIPRNFYLMYIRRE
jgi:hypothetical protein